MSKPVLSDADRERIAQAVVEAERKTSGEIVTLVVRASDHYPGARWRIAVAFTLLALAVLVMLQPALAAVHVLLAAVPLLGLGHLIAIWPPFLRAALGTRLVEEEVRQKAREAFIDLNVHATSDRTGVLIMVSLLEHRIEVLADTAIHASAPEGYWNQVVADLSARIRAGDLGGGLAEAVRQVGRLLEERFPARRDDLNELPDHVFIFD